MRSAKTALSLLLLTPHTTRPGRKLPHLRLPLLHQRSLLQLLRHPLVGGISAQQCAAGCAFVSALLGLCTALPSCCTAGTLALRPLQRSCHCTAFPNLALSRLRVWLPCAQPACARALEPRSRTACVHDKCAPRAVGSAVCKHLRAGATATCARRGKWGPQRKGLRHRNLTTHTSPALATLTGNNGGSERNYRALGQLLA
jgi:hypothetical protein